jgi:hypothetical protein
MMGPLGLIAILATIGLVAGGLGGAAIGAALGFLLTFVIAGLVRIVQGGGMPRKVRRALIVNLVANHPRIVASAFPGIEGDRLYKALEATLENTGKHAVRHAPRPDQVWTETAVTLGLKDMADQAHSEQMRALYRAVLEQVRTDWYPISVLRGTVEI